MDKQKKTKTELMELASEMLFLREEIYNDRLSGLFSAITLPQYNILKRIWPELSTGESRPEAQVTLKEMEANTKLQMSQISKIVERLSNAGLVVWERGQEGTYIVLSELGFDRFKSQQKILLEFFATIIDTVGVDKYHETIKAVKEIEEIINSAAKRED